MDSEPLNASTPTPRKRTPKKAATIEKTMVRKSRAKKSDDAVPESFSTTFSDTITCEYSNISYSENVEDWSPAPALNSPNKMATLDNTAEKFSATDGNRFSAAGENAADCNGRSGENNNGESYTSSDNHAGGNNGSQRGKNFSPRKYTPPNNSSSAEKFSAVDANHFSAAGENAADCNGRSGENNNGESYTSSDSHAGGNNGSQRGKNFPPRKYTPPNNIPHGSSENNRNRNFYQNNPQNNPQNRPNRRRPATTIRIGPFSIGYLRGLEYLDSSAKLAAFYGGVVDGNQTPLHFNEILDDPNGDWGIFTGNRDGPTSRAAIIDSRLELALAAKRPVLVKGILESMEGGDGIITYGCDGYKIRANSTFVPCCLIQSLGLRRGQTLTATIHPPLEQSTCPFAIKINDVLGRPPEEAAKFPRFKNLVPYYPTHRIFLERQGLVDGDNLSMRVIDLLSPIGFGQRGLIVAPPRTGKTILLQGIANAIIHNQPGAKLIVLLIDERPEEVTDFSRQVKGATIISSTFDESAESHVHAAEIVIESARRWVEAGEHVVILLDSITRLARAYNAEQPSSGKILSGGIEANALQLPKRFFGSARNIESGGSLTIIATALIETGSRMDDVIFEEFKGTGNMELHLDRSISDKRIFPAINFERSGTRREELLYHPDELAKIYNLRRVFQGVPSVEAMEMLISRVRKCPTNVEFLMNIAR